MRDFVDVYLVSTPRQWWLACAIALHHQSKNQSKHVLLIDNGFQGAEVFAELTRKWKQSPFEEVKLLFGKNDWQYERSKFKSGWLKRIEKYKRHAEFKSVLERFVVKEVYASNVGAWNLQYLMHMASKKDAWPSCSYLDDGTLSYYEQKQYSLPWRKYMERKLHYGLWYKRPRLLGENEWVHRGYVLSAKHVNSSLQIIPLVELNHIFFDNEALLDLADRVTRHFNFDFTLWKQAKTVLVLSKVSVLEKECPGYSEYIKFKVRHLDASRPVWIKYHPREQDADPLKLKEIHPDIHFIPSEIPFELLLSGVSDKDRIYGDISTVLMDAKLYLPELYVESQICAGAFPEVIKVFERLGITVQSMN
ncbi:MAG: hypothetical protein IE914_05600 [Thiotrichales bacterium]|nr:hypothetical protein [Thiotrichales bacterium]